MANITNINNLQEYEEFIKKDFFILYFGGEGCSVCQNIYPRLLNLLEEKNIDLGKVDIEKNKEASGQALIFTIPTILIFHENKEVLRESRFIDFNNIMRVLDLIEDN